MKRAGPREQWRATSRTPWAKERPASPGKPTMQSGASAFRRIWRAPVTCNRIGDSDCDALVAARDGSVFLLEEVGDGAAVFARGVSEHEAHLVLRALAPTDRLGARSQVQLIDRRGEALPAGALVPVVKVPCRRFNLGREA